MSGAGGAVTGGSAGTGTSGASGTGGGAGASGAGGIAGNAGSAGTGMGGEGGDMGGEGGEAGTQGGMSGAGGAGAGGAGAGGKAGGGGAGTGGAGAGGAGAGGAGNGGKAGGGAGGAGAGGAGAGGAGTGAGGAGAGAGGAGAGGAGAGGGGGSGGAMMAPNLYFSEYIEGEAIADAFEIYNATNASVSLAGCEIRVHYNAAAGSSSVTLSGSLAAGDVFVLCLARISTACDSVVDSLNDLSGNDSVELVCPVNGTMTPLDIIGAYGAGQNPGAEWGDDPGTQNQTLRRRCINNLTGDRNATNAFDPDPDWRPFPVDNVAGLGARTCPCPMVDLTCP